MTKMKQEEHKGVLLEVRNMLLLASNDHLKHMMPRMGDTLGWQFHQNQQLLYEQVIARLDAFLEDVPKEDKSGIGYERVNNQYSYLCECAKLIHTATQENMK